MLNLSTVNIRISKGICNYLMPPMFYSAIRTRQMLDKIPNEKSRLIFSRLPKCRAVSSPRCPQRRLLHSSPRLTPWWPTATGCCGMVAEPSRDLLMWWTSSGKWGRGSFSAPTIALSKLRFYYVQFFFLILPTTYFRTRSEYVEKCRDLGFGETKKVRIERI